MKKIEFGDILDLLEKEQKKQKSRNVKTIPPKKIPSKKVQKVYKESQKNLSFNVKVFESQMRQKLIKDHISYQNWKRPYISVSEILDCPRKTYFYRMKYETDLDKEFNFAYLYIICEVGKKIHSIIQDMYNFEEVEKTVISSKFHVKGKIDAVNKSTIYEFKTIDSKKFNGIVQDHYDQGSVYSWIMENECSRKIDNLCLVYVFRDLRTIKVFDVLPDLKRAEKLLKKSTIILDAIKTKKVPDTKDTSKCTFCPYKKYCKTECPKTLDNLSKTSMINLI